MLIGLYAVIHSFFRKLLTRGGAAPPDAIPAARI